MATNFEKQTKMKSDSFSLSDIMENHNNDFGTKFSLPFKKLYQSMVQNLGGIMKYLTTTFVSGFNNNTGSSTASPLVKDDTLIERYPFFIVGNVIGWVDFNEFPTREMLDNKFICVEYTQETHNSVLDWVKEVEKASRANEIEFDSILVFADYDKLSAAEVAKQVSIFDNVGALFTNFGKGCKSFWSAVEEYDKRVSRAKLRNNKYDTERKRLLETA